MEELIEQFRANPAPWLIGLFLGVFYWGFRGRWRQRKNQKYDEEQSG